MKKTFQNSATFRLTFLAIVTAMIIILQLLGSFIRFGPFSVSLVLLPIIVGVAYCGPLSGLWLGFVFGMVVILSGDAALFLDISPVGTFLTVLVKGMLCGLCAGLVYKLLEKVNRYAAVMVAAVVCPIVNTGVFLIGCRLFFWETVCEWAGDGDVTAYIFTGLVGVNFLFELASNLILSPVILRLINIRKKSAA